MKKKFPNRKEMKIFIPKEQVAIKKKKKAELLKMKNMVMDIF